jgi:hypothetical protein
MDWLWHMGQNNFPQKDSSQHRVCVKASMQVLCERNGKPFPCAFPFSLNSTNRAPNLISLRFSVSPASLSPAASLSGVGGKKTNPTVQYTDSNNRVVVERESYTRSDRPNNME